MKNRTGVATEVGFHAVSHRRSVNSTSKYNRNRTGAISHRCSVNGALESGIDCVQSLSSLQKVSCTGITSLSPLLCMAGRSLKKQIHSMEATKDIQFNYNKDSGTFSEGVWPGSCPMAIQSGPGRCPATVKRYTPMNVGCWNVRTLLDDTVNANRPEPRSALIAKELGHYWMDIIALLETRLAEEGSFAEETGSYTLFWSGKSKTCKRERVLLLQFVKRLYRREYL